jgi:hypothetical protein
MVVGILEFHTVTISYNPAIVIDEEILTALCDNAGRKLRLKGNICGNSEERFITVVRSTASPLVASIFVVCMVIG